MPPLDQDVCLALTPVFTVHYQTPASNDVRVAEPSHPCNFLTPSLHSVCAQTTSQARWYMVYAAGKVSVFKREGQVDPKYVLEVREFASVTRHDEKKAVILSLYDRTRIPLYFDLKQQMQDWWFVITLGMAQHKGMTLVRFVRKIVARRDLQCDGAVISASMLSGEKKSERTSLVAAGRGDRGSVVLVSGIPPTA